MDEKTRAVREFYDSNVQSERERLTRHPVEFEINKRFMLRYIKPGDKVLDIGGGPGRYALELAAMGCDVTLADLSLMNVDFALDRARELGLPLRAAQADARDLSCLAGEVFDHALLMGPLYHIEEKDGRAQAVGEALKRLKTRGTLFAAFISSYAGVYDVLKNYPERVLDPENRALFQDVFLRNADFSGFGFTHNHFIRREDVIPFMARFPLDKLHFLGSEGFLALSEPALLAQPPEVLAAWIDLAEKTCERPELAAQSEHFLYVGRKNK